MKSKYEDMKYAYDDYVKGLPEEEDDDAKFKAK